MVQARLLLPTWPQPVRLLNPGLPQPPLAGLRGLWLPAARMPSPWRLPLLDGLLPLRLLLARLLLAQAAKPAALRQSCDPWPVSRRRIERAAEALRRRKAGRTGAYPVLAEIAHEACPGCHAAAIMRGDFHAQEAVVATSATSSFGGSKCG